YNELGPMAQHLQALVVFSFEMIQAADCFTALDNRLCAALNSGTILPAELDRGSGRQFAWLLRDISRCVLGSRATAEGVVRSEPPAQCGFLQGQKIVLL